MVVAPRSIIFVETLYITHYSSFHVIFHYSQMIPIEPQHDPYNSYSFHFRFHYPNITPIGQWCTPHPGKSKS